MTTSKSLIAAIAAAATVGVIGLAYAQTGTTNSAQPGQDANRAAAMGTNSDTNLGKTPATPTGTMPATMPMATDSSTVTPGSTMSNPSTGTNMGTNMGTNTNPNAGMNNNNASDPNATMTERAARTDRN